MLDKKISGIQLLISSSSDPDSDGLCDRGEYFIGIGFVAIQQHLVETLLFTGINKNEAYKLGAIHSTGVTYISLINSAANWWKHEAEWVNKGEIPKNGNNTFDHVYAAAKTTDYALSNVLASICSSESISLSAVVPYLREWQAAILNAHSK
jgi:hypothetical protein